MNTLSVCIIAKNEEKNITRCLKSIKAIADEIIVIDTGSIDKTVTIAQEFNAKVSKFQWNNNFSEARNKALELATKDWILYLDCDEALGITQVSQIKEYINDTTSIGFCLKLINVVGNSPHSGPFVLRLFKNHEGFHFEGKIYEQIYPSIINKYSYKKIKNLQFILYHYGYDFSSEDFKSKNDRNIDILLNYNDNEKDAVYYYNLGNNYFASSQFLKSLESYTTALHLSQNNLDLKLCVWTVLIKSLYHLKDFENAIKNGENMLEAYPNYKDGYFLLGSCYEAIDDTFNSKENYKTYLKLSNLNNLKNKISYLPINNLSQIINTLNI